MGNMARERQLRRCVLCVCVWRIRDEVFLNIIIYNQSTSYAHMHTQSCSADEWKKNEEPSISSRKKMKSHANTASRYTIHFAVSFSCTRRVHIFTLYHGIERERERVTVFVDSTHILILHCTAVLSVSIYYTHLCINSKPLLATVFEYEFMFVYSKLCIVSQTLNYLCYKILKLQTQISLFCWKYIKWTYILNYRKILCHACTLLSSQCVIRRKFDNNYI